MMEQFVSIKHKLRGTTLLQLGLCGENPWIDQLTFRKQWLITPCSDKSKATLIASPNSLPFAKESVDCVFAPFLLEIFGREKCPLHEIDRILKPMGQIIFMGINPISLWGILLRFGYLECIGDKGALTSSLILKQILFNQGYRQTALNTFFYIPPIHSSWLLNKLRFLNLMGKMIAPSPAGFYCLVMQKHQLASIPPVPKRKKPRIPIGEQVTGLARKAFE